MEADMPLLLGRKKEELQGNQKLEIHSAEESINKVLNPQPTASKTHLKSLSHIKEAEGKPSLFLFISAICNVQEPI